MTDEDNSKLLGQLREFERTIGREQRSLIYAYLAAHNKDPKEIELVREQLPDDPERLQVRYYVQDKGKHRETLELEQRLAASNKCLRRALPKLMAHRRRCEAENFENSEEVLGYMDELMADIYDVLGIQTFVKDSIDE